jgi:putative DNA primase/helicase
LDEVFGRDKNLIAFFQRASGYCLSGDRREQVLFFLYGKGANGKSVLVELLQWIGGTYTIKLPATALMQSRGDRHPTELAQLRAKRLAVSSELDEGAAFNESLIKELTGDVTLNARFMRSDFFEFEMQQKHVIVGNFRPRLRGGDAAMARRLLLVPFTSTFDAEKRDLQMLERLKEEAPAILHWIIQGAKEWAEKGLAVPEAVRAASDEYLSEHDDLALWIEERCKPEGKSRASELYDDFTTWKKSRGEIPPSQTAWGSRLTSRPSILKQKSNGVWYEGISLIRADEPP